MFEKDPAAALDLLEETWDTESPADKVVFLELMGDGLSITDEPFLQRAQADRRQEVRHAAGRLLVQIPGSELHRQLLELADSAISFDGKKVHLSPPKKWPEWPAENGLVKKEKNPDSESILQSLVQWIPPAHWAERWPDKAFFKKALVDATIRYRDEAWALKILEYQVLAMDDLEISALQYAQLSALLSTEGFQQLIGRAWKDSDKDLESFDPAEELLLHSKHPWEATFSREWLGTLQALLITSGGDSWNLWDYREFLRQAAYRVPALPDAPWLEGWGEISPRTRYLWKDDVDYFLRVVRFRIDMHKAFE
ncbi:MAG: hypothetical protein IPJ40_11215 [Saprospirales bacterium]|nr:hypothetical protein [Saprospirales bacterium]